MSAPGNDSAKDRANNGGVNNNGEPDDGSPKFGRLLIVLILAVLLCVGITFGSLALLT